MRRPSLPQISIGDHFGYWRVLYVPTRRGQVLCQCQCLSIMEVNYYRLLCDGSKGCVKCRRDNASYKHGHTDTQVYKIWGAMLQRCTNPHSTAWKWYGGRGITVCDRWRHDFSAFLEDMGYPPTPRHSIERRNSNQGYSLENCYWATQTQQMRNTSRTHFLTYNGRTQCLTAWAIELGMKTETLSNRLRREGVSDRLFRPVKQRERSIKVAFYMTRQTRSYLNQLTALDPEQRPSDVLHTLIVLAAQQAGLQPDKDSV